MKYFIPHVSDSTSSIIHSAMSEVAQKTEESILGQLNEFIARKLISVEHTAPLLVADQNSTNLTLKYSVKLNIKDQEYIESLERQIKELQNLVFSLRKNQDVDKESIK